MAYRRWQCMTPEEKERYRLMARQYAERGRGIVGQARARRRDRMGEPPPPPGPPDAV